MDTLTDLTHFLRVRWSEEERQSALFHEFGCSAHDTPRTRFCDCPSPARIRACTGIKRQILNRLEKRIAHERRQQCWPLDSTLAFASMQALALPYELHPDWTEHWHP
ncbi:DUF6221 family protein [Streptomyces candidus]|uniref:Uncharacterized protein n=1 Tax=Streptomyces candidus TaxID=67283 RepID=A0A7X0LSM2_9ACTN|nr:DUF6221 family protein [Streptomyces candidus]MBB6439828.1 hypothetical protein [Streptomyces candidus]GHH57092.1 hypothetical protein GCM10018773_63950 [Streptomyces candidus]